MTERVYSKGRTAVKLAFKAIELALWIIGIWALGDIVALGLVNNGIEWVPVSTVGTLFIGWGGLGGTAVLDRVVDRLFELRPKGPGSGD